MQPPHQARRRRGPSSLRLAAICLMGSMAFLWASFIYRGMSLTPGTTTTTTTTGVPAPLGGRRSGASRGGYKVDTATADVGEEMGDGVAEGGRSGVERQGGGSSAEGCITTVSLGFSKGMVEAWRHFAGEKGAVFAGESAEVSFNSHPPEGGGLDAPCDVRGGQRGGSAVTSTPHSASIRFWGKSSAKLRLTKRRSLLITAGGEGVRPHPSAPLMKRFLLMSLWEDTYRLAYATTAGFLEGTDLWLPYTQLVELRCLSDDPSASGLCDAVGRGGAPAEATFGLYILIEFPEDAISRSFGAAPRPQPPSPFTSCMSEHWRDNPVPKPSRPLSGVAEVGVRVWRYHPKPAYYDVISFPSFASNSSLSKDYRRLAQVGAGEFLGEVSKHLDLQQYLMWLAFNSVLRNGDYDDEVFFIGERRAKGGGGGAKPPPLRIHAWDFDTVFEPCHKDGKFALKNQPLLYCAESDLDKKIAGNPTVFTLFKQTLSCLLHTHATPANWEASLASSLRSVKLLMDQPGSTRSRRIAKASYEGKTVPSFDKGAASLRKSFRERWEKLLTLLREPPPRGLGAAKMDAIAALQAVSASTSSSSSSDSSDRSIPVRAGGGGGGVGGGKQPPPFCPDGVSDGGPARFSEAKHSFSFGTPPAGEAVYLARFGAPAPATSAHLPGDGEVAPHQGGIYCLPNCSSSVVIRDKQRGKAEYGAPPWTRDLTMFTKRHSREGGAKEEMGIAEFGALLRGILDEGWGEEAAGGSLHIAFPPILLAWGVRHAGGGKEGAASASPQLVEVLSQSLVQIPIVLRRRGEGGNPPGWIRKDAELSLFGSPVELPYGIAAVMLTDPDTPNERNAPPHTYVALQRVPAAQRGDGSSTASTGGVPKSLQDILESSGWGGSASPCIRREVPKPFKGGARVVFEPSCVYLLKGEVVVPEGVEFAVPSRSTVFLLHSSTLFRVHGSFVVGGAATGHAGGPFSEMDGLSGHPLAAVLFTSSRPGKTWGGFVVHRGGSLRIDGAIISHTGGTLFKREKNTGSHHKSVPAVTLKEGATADLQRVHIVECFGPGFGAAKGASLAISDSLIQNVVQGGECKLCGFKMSDSAVMSIPNRHSDRYIDEDNDALYLTGGDHTVSGSVLAFTADDGIDTGTPSGVKKDGGVLKIRDTIIDAAQHEGLAISGVDRAISLENSVVRRCQQGVEMGYSSSATAADVSHTVLEENLIGIRYGDNYVEPCKGRLRVTDSVVRSSLALDVLNLVRKPLAPSTRLAVSRSVLPKDGGPDSRLGLATRCGLASFTGEGNIYLPDDQLRHSQATGSYQEKGGAGVSDPSILGLGQG